MAGRSRVVASPVTELPSSSDLSIEGRCLPRRPHFQSEVQHSPRSRHEGVPRRKGAGRQPDNSAPKGLKEADVGHQWHPSRRQGSLTEAISRRKGPLGPFQADFGRAGPCPSNAGFWKGSGVERNDRLQGGSAAVKTSSGVRYPSTFRGRRLIRSSTARTWASVT